MNLCDSWLGISELLNQSSLTSVHSFGNVMYTWYSGVSIIQILSTSEP